MQEKTRADSGAGQGTIRPRTNLANQAAAASGCHPNRPVAAAGSPD
ncbi:hypothetical protein BN1095_5680001 [Clostridioides difficile]|uniref:Uncharacterized protein n=1 Tax=Clostridioides difficile TaxID=1496 RepID=A0A069AZ33_CLODI|nr:hypothetical protein BN1095_5680001 [Clostridioides difficile]